MKNLYNQNKSQMTISLNSHYSVVFRNNWDASQFWTMAFQICLSNGKWLVNAFTYASSEPYEYLVLDHYSSTLQNTNGRDQYFI